MRSRSPGWTTNWLVSSAPLDGPRLDTTPLASTSVWQFMVALTATAGVLASLWPALFVGRIDPGRTLTAGRRTAMHPRERRLQRIIVGCQVAVAVVLLVGASLFVRTVQTLDRTEIGSARRVSVDRGGAFAEEPERWDTFYEHCYRERVSSLGSPAPSSCGRSAGRSVTTPSLSFAGQESSSDSAALRSKPRVNLESTTAGYFQTLRTPLCEDATSRLLIPLQRQR